MDIVTPENKKESYRLFDKIAKTYDLLNIILSLGIDRIWRRKITKLIGNSKIENAVDLATGTADMAILLGKKKNITQVLGLDMSKEMIGIGKQKVLRGKLAQKVTLEIGDGMNIPLESSSQDLITITFGIRNYGDYMKGLKEMHRILKEKGRCIIMEFSLPKNFLIKKFYLFYFRKFLPLIGRIISKDDMAYTYLNKTVESFPYGEHFSEKMKEAGFSNIKIHELTLGIASIYVAEK